MASRDGEVEVGRYDESGSRILRYKLERSSTYSVVVSGPPRLWRVLID
jgi:hypothetical protein